MLYAYINGNGETVIKPDGRVFITTECLDVPEIIEALEDVEGVYKIEGLAFYTKEHGVLSPESISNGIRALMLLYYQHKGVYDEIISSACFGDNVGKYVQKMSLNYNIHIAWDSYLPMDWNAPILATNVSTGDVITDIKVFQDEVGHYGGEPGVKPAIFTSIFD